MSNLSIYETSWIDLVFEGKNKEYGAYQLRKQSTKTVLAAFFMGLLSITAVGGICVLAANLLHKNDIIKIPPELNIPIKITDIVINEVKKEVLPIHKKVIQNNPDAVVDQKQLKNPIIVESKNANQDIAKNTDNSSVVTPSNDGTGIVGKNATDDNVGTQITTSVPPVDGIVSTVALDKLPEFPGGIKNFYNYVGNNFEKPDLELDQAIRVYVSFVIERDGSMTDIKVVKDPGHGLGKEAIRVLKSLKTKWAPGLIGGKPVRTSYSLPIVIQME